MNTNKKTTSVAAIDIKILTIITVCIIGGLCLSSYGYASGTDPNSIDPNSATDPNVVEPNSITSVYDWVSLANTPSAWEKSFVLTCDIDLTGITLSPIGTLSLPFTGYIDGNGHVIRNAHVDSPDDNYVGLIGYLGKEGRVSKLGVESVSVTGNKFVGGLAGCVYFGSIEQCYCSGTVIGRTEVGGLTGRNSGQITGCYSNCSVSGNTLAGGLVGVNKGLSSYVKASYSIGLTTCTDADGYSGGLVGNNGGFIYACFWDIETSGLNGSRGGIGLTTDRMKDVATYQNAGWFEAGWTIDNGQDYPRPAWENANGESVPEAAAIALNGTGTENDPYQVSSADELAMLGRYASISDKCVVFTSDIDASGTEVCPIGNLGPFTGVFDGDGHIIENLTITNEANDYAGLFGFVHKATISNLGVHNINVTGSNYVGGLIGCNLGGKVCSCYVTGKVSGESNVGGLIGYSSVNISQN